MFGNMAEYAHNFCKNSTGTIKGAPRISNITRGTELVGYSKVNTQATTAFSRTKVHKGYFYCAPEEDVNGLTVINIANGDLITDKVEKQDFFIMSVKSIRGCDETVYLDGTLYACDSFLSVERFSAEGTRDAFGRVVAVSTQVVPQLVAATKGKDNLTIYAMTIPKNFDVISQQDREIAQNKISLCVQTGADIKISDRLTDTDTGEVFRVMSIDYKSIKGLKLLFVDMDVR